MIKKDFKMSSITIIAIYIICSVFGQVLFKYGANRSFDVRVSNSSFILSINVIAIAGIVLYIASFLLFLIVLSRFQISYIFPIIIGIIYILIMLCAVVILKEKINISGIVGAVLIAIGIVIINLPKI